MRSEALHSICGRGEDLYEGFVLFLPSSHPKPHAACHPPPPTPPPSLRTKPTTTGITVNERNTASEGLSEVLYCMLLKVMVRIVVRLAGYS